MALIPSDSVEKCCFFTGTWYTTRGMFLNKVDDVFILVFVKDWAFVRPHETMEMHGAAGLVFMSDEPGHHLAQGLSF